MHPERLFWKLFLSLIICILAASALFGAFLHRHLYNTTLSNVQTNLKKETEVLAELTINSPDLLQQPAKIARALNTEDRITIIASDGTVLADNWAERLGKAEIENHANRVEFKAAMAGRPVFSQHFSRAIGREMLYYAIPIKQNHDIVVLRLAVPLTAFSQQMAEITRFLIFAAILAVLLSLPFAWSFSRSITGPIERLRESANRLSSGDLNQRVVGEGTMEFRELAQDFNSMAGQLTQKIQSVEQQHNRNRALLARMVEGVFAVDQNGKAVFANAAFSGMIGLKMDRIDGRSYLEISRNEQLSKFIYRLLKPLPDPEIPDASEIKFYGPEGERSFSVQASRIQENGNALILLVFHDITRIKAVEQIRKDFVANVSHELRTPLTALKGSTEVLLDGAYRNPEECRKFLEIMDKQLRNVQNLVIDMLKLANVDNTGTPFQRETVEVKSFLSEIVSILEPLAQKKRQAFTVTLPAEEIRLNIDPGQIADAITNLLDNAIKYTDDSGEIQLIARRVDHNLEIQVKDNGPGIPSDQISRIFERFYRIDKSRSREMGGTGLGLAITKHAVENHGGNISVESEYGRGSTFTITLPL